MKKTTTKSFFIGINICLTTLMCFCTPGKLSIEPLNFLDTVVRERLTEKSLLINWFIIKLKGIGILKLTLKLSMIL
jgi:hypothetical protein